jgi:hypothetical protein
MAAPLDDVATWEPVAAAPPVAPPEPTGPAHSLPVSAIGERCPSCRARVATDQRYCLECGQRRGEPRLPFMDAVSFMDAVARRRRGESPPTPPRSRRRMSPNTSLIAGVGTLLLAMGVGVLIGQSAGHSESGASAKPAVQVVKVPSSGGAVTAAAASAPSGKSAKSKASSHGIGGHAAKSSAAGSASSGGGAASVLHPKAKLPPPTVQVGGSCNGGAGCKNGKFTGSFFGE